MRMLGEICRRIEDGGWVRSICHHWGGCSYNGSTYHVDQCYQSAMIQKLNGTKVPALWYSSLASGYCASPCAPLRPQPHKKRRRPCARSPTALCAPRGRP